MRNIIPTVASIAAVILVSAGSVAQKTSAASSRPMTWTTLGTAGGPLVQSDRSQPANMLVAEGKPWLIDCGDGVSERLVAAGFTPAQVDTLFISHLHVDHTAGLLGLIGLRWMTRAPHALIIYGPSGTEKLVAGIIQALQPAMRIGIGMQGANWGQPVADTVDVRLLRGDSDITIDGIRVRAVKNSHFSDPEGHEADNGSESLSYRFEKNAYSIGYSGDTGPSAAVTELERGADLLISEVIDLEGMVAEINQRYPEMPPAAKQSLIIHFTTQHLTPGQAGALASNADVKRLVLTHLTALGKTPEFASRLTAEVHKTSRGQVFVARDLDHF